MALFRKLGVNPPEADKFAGGGQVCGVAWATHSRYASAHSLVFLDLTEGILIYELETLTAILGFLDGHCYRTNINYLMGALLNVSN
jgi:hypothetical protein